MKASSVSRSRLDKREPLDSCYLSSVRPVPVIAECMTVDVDGYRYRMSIVAAFSVSTASCPPEILAYRSFLI